MKILVVEDDPNKMENVVSVLESHIAHCFVRRCTTFKEGQNAMYEEEHDLFVLDMTLPVFREQGEDFGATQVFGGRALFTDALRRNRAAPTIFVTQFETFGSDESQLTLRELRHELLTAFPKHCLGVVYYRSTDTEWAEELLTLVHMQEET